MTVMNIVERNRNQSLQASIKNVVWSIFILHTKYERLSWQKIWVPQSKLNISKLQAYLDLPQLKILIMLFEAGCAIASWYNANSCVLLLSLFVKDEQ